VGIIRHPTTKEIWTGEKLEIFLLLKCSLVCNERDLLGDDSSPDYLTRVTEGSHYGWPHLYWGIPDTARTFFFSFFFFSSYSTMQRVTNWPALSVPTIKPDYALGSHTASLGLAWSTFSHPRFSSGVFIGQVSIFFIFFSFFMFV
jgi:glucose/arabinose dehydrogenase